MGKTRKHVRSQSQSKSKLRIQKVVIQKKEISKYNKLYPETKPLGTFTIQVSPIHTVAYWTYGNPKGKPVVFIHGGPGAGTMPKCARFFDPKAYFIVLVDQRGSGESKPFGELRENTTNDLIEDFEKIRKLLGIQKWMLFGGSWGSTLTLAYAIAHPECVTEMVIRGVFLIRQSEIDWFIQPRGTQSIYPEAWAVFQNGIPQSELKDDISKMDFLNIYGKCFHGDFGNAAKEKALLAWSVWETAVSHLYPESIDEITKMYLKTKGHRAMSAIEYHYFKNKGFFGDDDYFLRQSNIDRIKHLPLTIVQGKYDVLCPSISAYDLYQKLPHAKFHATIAGHSAFDDGNVDKLVEATDMYKKRS